MARTKQTSRKSKATTAGEKILHKTLSKRNTRIPNAGSATLASQRIHTARQVFLDAKASYQNASDELVNENTDLRHKLRDVEDILERAFKYSAQNATEPKESETSIKDIVSVGYDTNDLLEKAYDIENKLAFERKKNREYAEWLGMIKNALVSYQGQEGKLPSLMEEASNAGNSDESNEGVVGIKAPVCIKKESE